MKRTDFILSYIILTFAQLLLCNFLNFTPLLYLCILPVMVLMIPVKCSTNVALFVAFATGMAVDLLADGFPGLNTAALVAVAIAREPVITLTCGNDVFVRKENISIARNGLGKISMAILMEQALFLLIYIFLDGSEARSFLFSLGRFGLSLVAGYLVSLLVCRNLTDDRGRRWR